MRIRKRKVPLPISLLSPIPLTDHHLFSRSPVTLVQPVSEDDRATVNNNNVPQPSDHLTSVDLHRTIDDVKSSSDHCHGQLVKKQEVLPLLVGCLGHGAVESVPNSNDSSNKRITALGAAADSTNAGPFPSSHHEEGSGWCNKDKAMPLKKRRSTLEQENNTTNNVEKPGIDKDEMKNHATIDNNNNGASSENKKVGSKRGNTIMEGSRCSRVNGRGWRCCQPTLVGYALCEHHLGKGRLRSPSNARGRPSSLSTNSKKAALGMSSNDPTCEERKKESGNVAKKVKLGVVKARSLSSLLVQMADTTSPGSGGLTIGASIVCDEKEANVNK